MFRLTALKSAASLGDLARLLDFKPSALSYVLYKQSDATKYTTFQIPKRSGGQRTIKAPIDALKLLQRKLSILLQDCIEEINEANHRKDRIAHGFKRRHSIVTNADRHRHRRYVFNLDLEDFFPSINFGRVRGFLIKNRDFQLHASVATVIAQIACHENSLPQGSPCSPVISNMVAHMLDMRLVKLASTAGCTYSRYADDLTFSTNKKSFPGEIGISSNGEDGQHFWLPGQQLRDIVERTGFRINTGKTHLMYRCSRQAVTGLVVNQRINVQSEYRHDVRAMVHRLVTTGAFEIYGLSAQGERVTIDKRPGSLSELHGMLGFVDAIDAHNNGNSSDLEKPSSSERVYRDFLLYTNFYAAKTPVVLSEGETDNIYLTHAIRSLAAEFPDLAEVVNGKIRLKIRLFKYPHSSTARILQLKGGGSGVLGNFIGKYNRETRHFTAPGLTHPVVILYDNDAGAKSVRSAIKQVAKLTVTGDEPFVRVVKNIYALPVPHVAGATESKIEDCFDAQTKAVMVDGKTFNDSNVIDPAVHFGKNVFAHRVVRPKAEAIDFSGFRPLLANLVTIISTHKAEYTAANTGA